MSHTDTQTFTHKLSVSDTGDLEIPPWNFKRTPLGPIPLVPDRGRGRGPCRRESPVAREEQQSGHQGLRIPIHPQCAHQAKKTDFLNFQKNLETALTSFTDQEEQFSDLK